MLFCFSNLSANTLSIETILRIDIYSCLKHNLRCLFFISKSSIQEINSYKHVLVFQAYLTNPELNSRFFFNWKHLVLAKGGKVDFKRSASRNTLIAYLFFLLAFFVHDKLFTLFIIAPRSHDFDNLSFLFYIKTKTNRRRLFKFSVCLNIIILFFCSCRIVVLMSKIKAYFLFAKLKIICQTFGIDHSSQIFRCWILIHDLIGLNGADKVYFQCINNFLAKRRLREAINFCHITPP